MKRITISLLLLFLCNQIICQSTFRLYPGSTSGGYSVARASDVRGFLFLSNYKDSSNEHLAFTKFNLEGNRIWDKYILNYPHAYLLGDTSVTVSLDEPLIKEVSDGYILAFIMDSTAYFVDSASSYYQRFDSMCILKLDTSGSILWSRIYDFPLAGSAPFQINTDSSGFVYIMRQSYLMKTDSSGNVMWCLKIANSTSDIFSGFDITSTGQVIVAGKDSLKPYLLKLDPGGNILAIAHINVNLSKPIVSVIANPDGYTLLLDNGPGLATAFLIKSDTILNIVWSKSLGINSTSTCFYLLKDLYGQSIVDILYNSIPANYSDLNYNAFCRLDSNGSITQTTCYQHYFRSCGSCYAPDNYYQRDMNIDPDNGFIFLREFVHNDYHYPQYGYSYFYLEKNDNLPDSCFACSPPSVSTTTSFISTASTSKTSSISFPFSMSIAIQLADISRICAINCLQTVGLEELKPRQEKVQVYPNPCKGIFHIKSAQQEIRRLAIYNVYGEKVFYESINSKEKTISVNLLDGIYMLKIDCGKVTYSNRLIISH